MKHQLHYEKNIPKYFLMSVALVQSEIYWLYSALYCVFRESGLLAPDRSTAIALTRHRLHSSRTCTGISAFTNDHFVKLDQSEAERRLSTPTYDVNYRQRPNVHDEQKGTTCPPLWWQKTRVKLGRVPGHGDPKPKSIQGSASPLPSSSTSQLSPSTANDIASPNSTSMIRRNNTSYPNSNSCNTLSPVLTSKSLTYPSTTFPALSTTPSHHLSGSFDTIEQTNKQPKDIDLSRQASEKSAPSISSQALQQNKKKFMSKLNIALHNVYHRRADPNGSIKNNKK